VIRVPGPGGYASILPLARIATTLVLIAPQLNKLLPVVPLGVLDV